MGIKYIHVTLIVVSIVFAAGFGVWTLNHHYRFWACCCFAAAIALLIYCVQFIKKMKVL